MRMLDLETLDEYRAAYHDESIWTPVAQEICLRHGLENDAVARGPDGTHIVFFVGDALVLKLFSPLFPDDIEAESLVTPHLAGRLGVRTPAIVGRGVCAGWRYLLMTRVDGRPAVDLWSELTRSDQLNVVSDVGRLVGRLREVSLEGLGALEIDWVGFLKRQLGRAHLRETPCGMDLSFSDVESFAGTVEIDRRAGGRRVLLLADITDEHLLLTKQDGARGLFGLVDFGDAFIGHPDYELVAPGLTLARGDREFLRTLLVSAGYDVDGDAVNLRRRLMLQTLVHRYATLVDAVRTVPDAAGAASLEELSRRLWPVD
ncbi:MAG: phosphotransferase [Candidatus Eisenbacteria bacterium]|nr:phosphotransferase [Candidatus Eisenbacteria bacterium]